MSDEDEYADSPLETWGQCMFCPADVAPGDELCPDCLRREGQAAA